MINDPQTGEGFDAPTPALAYADAPSIPSEITAVLTSITKRSTEWRLGLTPASVDDREFWLRKAALFDRVALEDATADAIAAAAETAGLLVTFDLGQPTSVAGPHGPDSTEWDPSYRPYVRQEYAAWHKDQ
ncbi:hypothetical protein [Streptomyces sp. H39-C1]|uniref:hypothetical protein n=1 Tax=Streptomyces sp. H39-C1 TaxID=3004355 RepID=UPI0022B02642|nr:hypothetical protein [Streptomyces sp. H39-C1]MCZ4096003.1 hypothetical protein [Streptomyces sp. H39-C1]